MFRKRRIFEVVPGVSVGDFVLGTPLADLIEMIEADDSKPKCEVLYDEKNPLSRDVMLKLDYGVLLRFEPRSQRLRLVEIFDSSSLSLVYYGGVFAGGSVEATFFSVYKVFGPTYPGKFDAVNSVYHLNYPGLSFMLPVPQKYAHLYDGSGKSSASDMEAVAAAQRRHTSSSGAEAEAGMQEMPLFLPDGTTPTVARVFIFNGTSLEDMVVPTLRESYDYDDGGKLHQPYYFQEVRVKLIDKDAKASGNGSASIWLTKTKRRIYFGDSAQDVLMKLGPPQSVLRKTKDRLRIHAMRKPAVRKKGPLDDGSFVQDDGGAGDIMSAMNDENRGQLTAEDYFFNYYEHGIDIMFDGNSHAVNKIILHTNFPGSRDFHNYKKCNFRIPVEDLYALAGTRAPSAHAHSHGAYGRMASASSSSARPTVIHPDMTFQEVKGALPGLQHTKPLVHSSTSSIDPFGSTRFFAYHGCIFEVLKNEHVNSVCLYKES